MKNWTRAALVAALGLGFAGAAQADELIFTLKNETKSVINAFYASPAGVRDWEEDIFGEDVLSPGETMRITIRDGRRTCKYDLRFEFQGDELEDMQDSQDICEMSSYTVTQ